MFPHIHLGSRTIDTQSLSLLVMLAVVVPVAIRRLRTRQDAVRRTLPETVDMLFYLVIGTLIGGFLGRFVPHAFMVYVRHEPIPAGWYIGDMDFLGPLGGMHWMGSLAGISLAAYLYSRRNKMLVGRAFDLMAPMIPLGLAIVRVGCLARGCCAGIFTDSWLAVMLRDHRGIWGPRYPAQPVSIVVNLLIFGLLLGYEQIAHRRQGKPWDWPFYGFTFLLYVQLYCIQRFYFEFWRVEMPMFIDPFTWTHVYCVVGIGLATWFMVRGFRQARLAQAVA